MARVSTSGQCSLCGGTFGKIAMARHVRGCKGLDALRKDPAESFHLVVEGGYRNVYWLHLAVPQELSLKTLDGFLRGIWLECCGHLSAFTINGQRYAAAPMEDAFDSGWQERSMSVPVSRVLAVGTRFSHEYDYGSTTEISLRVVGTLDAGGKQKSVTLLARNQPPPIVCEECGAPASQVCSQCLWQGNGWLCDECMEDHECGEEMCLPVVNSPRVGVCGYTG